MLVNNSSFNNVSNASVLPEPSMVYAVVGALQGLVTLSGSSLCLLAFATSSVLQTPFNYFLISSCLSNILIVIYQIMVAIQEYYGCWVFSARACTCFLLSYFWSHGTRTSAYLFISANRSWALLFPIHYRTHNSKKLAMILCIGLWALSISLSDWIFLNEAFLGEPITLCRIRQYTQPTFTILIMIPMFASPLSIMASYPILFIKHRARNKARASLVAKRFNGGQVAPAVAPVTESSRPKTLSTTVHHVHAERIGNIEPGPNKPANRRKHTSNTFLILTWVTFEVTVFWLPPLLYYLLEIFLYPGPWFATSVFEAVGAWLECSSCLEPLVIIATQPPIRQQIMKLLHFKHER